LVSVDAVNSTFVVLPGDIDVGTDDPSLFVAVVVIVNVSWIISDVVLSIFELSNVEEGTVDCNFVVASSVDEIAPTLVDRSMFVGEID